MPRLVGVRLCQSYVFEMSASKLSILMELENLEGGYGRKR
jgi:hypothetical protein